MTLLDPPATTSPRHRLTSFHMDALARGGGDADTVGQLLAAERSWRLVQLRAVLEAVADTPDATGPLPPVAQAWQVLVQAQRRDPAAVDTLLLHPQGGTWAGYVLRRLRGSHPHPAEDPLWIDVGYLHALAAAAAVRAGLDFSLRVPVRDGFLILPTLGGAWLPVSGRWEQAEVHAADGAVQAHAAGDSVRIGPAPSPEWTPLPQAHAEADGLTLTVTVDHLDPYRNLRAPAAPEQLTGQAVRRWQRLLTEAWQLLVSASPQLAAPIARGLLSVTPLPPAGRFRTRSASSGDAFGGMIASEPEDAAELAVTLVHEFQHIKLGGLLHLAPLQQREPAQRWYAPWRDDPRPLGGLLQGVYAFAGIVEFWRALRPVAAGRTAPLAQFEFARWRGPVAAVLRDLAAAPELTDLGRRLVAGLSETAQSWQREPVPAHLRTVAEAAAADHRSRWRVHHLRPDPGLVQELSSAWTAGVATAPTTAGAGPAVVATDPAARALDTHAVLALWRLTDIAGFARLQQDPAAVGELVPGATEADLAYVVGEWDEARERYLAQLAGDPGNPGAWSGLALVDDAATATVLSQQPELLAAVASHLHTAGVPADPRQLARWLA